MNKKHRSGLPSLRQIKARGRRKILIAVGGTRKLSFNKEQVTVAVSRAREGRRAKKTEAQVSQGEGHAPTFTIIAAPGDPVKSKSYKALAKQSASTDRAPAPSNSAAAEAAVAPEVTRSSSRSTRRPATVAASPRNAPLTLSARCS